MSDLVATLAGRTIIDARRYDTGGLLELVLDDGRIVDIEGLWTNDGSSALEITQPKEGPEPPRRPLGSSVYGSTLPYASALPEDER